ncbi:MAG: hypothetical protein C5B47_02240 [Verrucomicrobia bacterium]|nr:MAG: hypothetical protein C5B47_02240 [Verrucomicrobiota bacterium]
MSEFASILLINPFFGPWPPWMAAFLESCRFNADIHWLLLGDQSTSWQMPPNVRLQKMTLTELLERASTTIGCKVQKITIHSVTFVLHTARFLRMN